MKKNLKPVDKANNPGLAKLPTGVRNKMGYMKEGGAVGKAKGKSVQVKEVDALLAQLKNKLKEKLGKKDGGDVTNLPPSQRSIQEKLRKFVKENGRTPSTDSEVDSVYGKGASEREMTRVGKTVKSRSKVKKAKDGGMVLEIGLRPATKSEMKMAKGMKKPKKMANGGMARGTGAAIRGKGFRGVF
tara:strand:+ start:162 stop:719 length:558 start_codon:yes stop_codon:yes gene_type:complete